MSDVRERMEDLVEHVQEWASDPSKIRRFLRLSQGGLSGYSPSNQMLILRQDPEATHVGPFGYWLNMGRAPVKGSKAMEVLSPYTYRVTEEDPDTGEEVEVAYTGYRIRRSAFDVSSTEGDPVEPEPEGTPAQLAELEERGQQILEALSARLEYAPLGSAVPSLIDEGLVTINSRLSEAERVAALIHAAALLCADPSLSGGDRDWAARAAGWYMCDRVGMDLSDNVAFHHVVTYQGRTDFSEVLTAASNIISRVNALLLGAPDEWARVLSGMSGQRI